MAACLVCGHCNQPRTTVSCKQLVSHTHDADLAWIRRLVSDVWGASCLFSDLSFAEQIPIYVNIHTTYSKHTVEHLPPRWLWFSRIHTLPFRAAWLVQQSEPNWHDSATKTGGKHTYSYKRGMPSGVGRCFCKPISAFPLV